MKQAQMSTARAKKPPLTRWMLVEMVMVTVKVKVKVVRKMRCGVRRWAKDYPATRTTIASFPRAHPDDIASDKNCQNTLCSGKYKRTRLEIIDRYVSSLRCFYLIENTRNSKKCLSVA
ncbi:hypothetical protein F442_17006 [Phytophthora nicotianae P10297]|uniref:Uncharacterized protein n=4 Tax=Phytophthora nicotianae TaxID=4792 RepID=V9ECC8_PHYNI|nr:hypothetical protein F443_17131 [Phytophthora nicotianae P1569]ETL83663.1 hypothetical protein L917_16401 [Phytophthora nicotianae]ETO65505.1 hypothetical protein F444_17173 [Phytophthora nicotianae P1976]ETP34692.1 hypothetical protein F442_17006 [Phytophthora nicotianae P10297]